VFIFLAEDLYIVANGQCAGNALVVRYCILLPGNSVLPIYGLRGRDNVLTVDIKIRPLRDRCNMTFDRWRCVLLGEEEHWQNGKTQHEANLFHGGIL
jgi:hypothetical protein